MQKIKVHVLTVKYNTADPVI